MKTITPPDEADCQISGNLIGEFYGWDSATENDHLIVEDSDFYFRRSGFQKRAHGISDE